MVRPATAHDLLELRRARPSKGHLVHTECGGAVVWSLMVDGAYCRGCGKARWDYAYLLDRDNPKGKPELYKWVPPVEIHDDSPRK